MLNLDRRELRDLPYLRVRIHWCLVLNMSFAISLRRTYLLLFVAVAIVGCQAVVDNVYEEKGSPVGRMTVLEIEDALQVRTYLPLFGFCGESEESCH